MTDEPSLREMQATVDRMAAEFEAAFGPIDEDDLDETDRAAVAEVAESIILQGGGSAEMVAKFRWGRTRSNYLTGRSE